MFLDVCLNPRQEVLDAPLPLLRRAQRRDRLPRFGGAAPAGGAPHERPPLRELVQHFVVHVALEEGDFDAAVDSALRKGESLKCCGVPLNQISYGFSEERPMQYPAFLQIQDFQFKFKSSTGIVMNKRNYQTPNL